MTGVRGGGSIPLWLVKSNDAANAVAWFLKAKLRRKDREAAIEAQVRFVDFERHAREEWHEANRLKGSLCDWIADHREILDEAMRFRHSQHGDIRFEWVNIGGENEQSPEAGLSPSARFGGSEG